MTLAIQQGSPIYDGLYVIYSDGLAGYTLQDLAMWRAKGGWYYRFSEQQFKNPVFGWVGPLPENFTMPKEAPKTLFERAAAASRDQDYDL